ncbi:hypothetical protein EDD16DRAFT_1525759 [Pisolithus croceorrhizus]|nr:hypothetical protein EV401DRAFT_1895121 [Pisolithus croceorrhizus]KAI6101980.1 hypothetical protein EDD16DRAFT_1525759 [Pisolithus croceorrhizus]KAI6168839.1 hypothetical protein EDD17DRAFT_1502839 [Pisolithus thermaeus]
MPRGNDEGVPRCPTVCYSKHDLYDLVDKQKKAKIDSYQALLNYQLSFTDITAQLQISSQLSWIEKDDLFLKGFDQEFQGEILRRLKWNDQREYADNPWPTCQDSLKPLEVPGEGSRGQAVKVEGIEIAAAELSSLPLVKVLKLVPEPRGDLHKVPEQAGSVEVEEIESGVKAKGQSKVVAWRKPPEVKIQEKFLKSVTWKIREILPEFWTTHSSSSDAAVEIYASLSQKSKNYLFESYEILGGKAIWSAASSFQGYEVGDQAEAKPRAPLALRTRPELYPSKCMKVFEESDEHKTPLRLICLLWRVLLVFLEDTLWSGYSKLKEPHEGQEMRRIQSFKVVLEGSQAKCHCHFRYIPTTSSPSLKKGDRLQASLAPPCALIWTLDPFKKASCLNLDPQPLQKGFMPQSGPLTPSKRLCASIVTLDPFVKALYLVLNPQVELDKLQDSVLPLYLKPWVWEVTEDSQDSKTPLDVGSRSSLVRD